MSKPLYRCAQCCDYGCEFCPAVRVAPVPADDVEPWPEELFTDYTDAELARLILDGIHHLKARQLRLRHLEAAWSL